MKNEIVINRIKTIYGYDKNIKDLNLYIKSNIKNNNFSKIYEQKKEQGVRFTNTASS
jgi:ribosomal protein S19E (S16A)